MSRSNTFEGGTNGVALSTANTGGASGDAVDGVSIGAGGTLAFSNAQAAHGTLSCLSATGASSVACYGFFTLAAVTGDYQRWYVKLPTLPGVERGLFSYRSGAGQSCRISINAAGQINVRNAANTTLLNSTVTLSAGSWFRLEWHITFSATVGAVTLRIYTSMDSTTIAETMTITNAVLTATSDQFRFGVPASAALAVDAYMDDASIEGGGFFGPSVVPGTVTHGWVGAPTDEGYRVVAKMAACSSVELRVATDSGMASVVGTFGPDVPDADGYVDLTATGLDPATQYWWQLADVGTAIGSIGKAKTLPTPGAAAAFKFAFGGCTLNDNAHSEAFTDLRGWGADFLVHLGDLHYRDPNTAVVATHRGYIEGQIVGAAGLAQTLREVPTMYCRSDHDAGPGDNLDSNTSSNQASIDAYKQVVPAYPLGYGSLPTVGLYQSWVVGRVRFIMVDIRNMDRSAGLSTQGPSKTMLGATQLAWLLSELDEDEPLKIIISDVAWMGDNPSPITDAQDKWPAYADERQTIIDHIAANAIKVILLHSDTHSLARATAATNTLGAFPIYCAAPFGNIGGGRYLSTFTDYYNSGAAQGSQYGRVEVTDTGSLITVTYTGRDALNAIDRLTQIDSFDTGDPSTVVGYVNSASVSNGSSTTSINIPIPAGVVSGDDLFAVVAHLKSSSPETTITGVPAGWALLGTTTDGTGLRMAIYQRRATGAEPGSYTWTISAAFKSAGWIGCYRGLSLTAPVLDVALDDGDSGTVHATPGVSALVGDWLLSAVATRHTGGSGVTTWSNGTVADAERYEFGSNAGSQDITMAIYDSAGPAGTGTLNRTLTSSQTESLVITASVTLRAGGEALPEIPSTWGIPAIIT